MDNIDGVLGSALGSLGLEGNGNFKNAVSHFVPRHKFIVDETQLLSANDLDLVDHVHRENER